jgi:hypothetical protein
VMGPLRLWSFSIGALRLEFGIVGARPCRRRQVMR